MAGSKPALTTSNPKNHQNLCGTRNIGFVLELTLHSCTQGKKSALKTECLTTTRAAQTRAKKRTAGVRWSDGKTSGRLACHRWSYDMSIDWASEDLDKGKRTLSTLSADLCMR